MNTPIKIVKELYFTEKYYHERLKEIKKNFEDDVEKIKHMMVQQK